MAAAAVRPAKPTPAPPVGPSPLAAIDPAPSDAGPASATPPVRATPPDKAPKTNHGQLVRVIATAPSTIDESHGDDVREVAKDHPPKDEKKP
jgi:hypothetical protein